ncbi:MAG: ABC transporter substrate-binding protein [Calditrichota bacterium]
MKWILTSAVGWGLMLYCLGQPIQAQASSVRAVFFLPFTGSQADLALDLKTAAELAVQAMSGLNQDRLRLEFADNYNHPDSARNTALRIAAEAEVKLFLGGYPSSCCRAINDVAEERGIPHLIAAASDDQLTMRPNNWTFRLNPPSSDYNDALMSWMVKVVGNQRKLAVLNEDRAAFAAALEDIKEDLHVHWSGETAILSYASGTQDFIPIIKIIRDQKPALIYLLGSGVSVARFLRQCREANYLPAAFVLGSAHLVSNRFISLAAGAAEGALAPMVWSAETNRPGVPEFLQAFTEKTGAPLDYHAAEAYAAVQVAWSVGARFKSPPSREDVRDALDQTDLNTVFGHVSFDSYKQFQRQNRTPTLAVQLQGEHWTVVWPPSQAEKQFGYPLRSWNKRDTPLKTASRDTWIALIMIFIAGLAMLSAMLKHRNLTRKINR